MLFVVSLLPVCGCSSSEGAAAISDQLTWAANRMNLFGGDERTVVYSPVSNNPYWIMVVPEGTAPERLATFGFPASVGRVVLDCAESSGTVIVMVEETRSSCLTGSEFPEKHVLLGVTKQSREQTRFTIRRNGRGLELVAMK